MGLHNDQIKLGYLIDYYNTSYIVFGRYYTWDARHFSQETVEYIMENPDKFEFVDMINEDYSNFYNKEDPHITDDIYIYKVKGKG